MRRNRPILLFSCIAVAWASLGQAQELARLELSSSVMAFVGLRSDDYTPYRDQGSIGLGVVLRTSDYAEFIGRLSFARFRFDSQHDNIENMTQNSYMLPRTASSPADRYEISARLRLLVAPSFLVSPYFGAALG